VLDKLNFLIALAQEQHFGRADEACGVIQPTLSAGCIAVHVSLVSPEGQRTWNGLGGSSAMRGARRPHQDRRRADRTRDGRKPGHALSRTSAWCVVDRLVAQLDRDSRPLRKSGDWCRTDLPPQRAGSAGCARCRSITNITGS